MASSNWGDAWGNGSNPLGDLPWGGGLSALFEPYRLPGVDPSALLEWQHDDWDALLEAQRQAWERLMVLFERRSEMLDKWLLRWREGVSGAGGFEAWSQPMALWKGSLDQALEDLRELADMEVQARVGAWQVLQDRLQQNMARLQDLWRVG